MAVNVESAVNLTVIPTILHGFFGRLGGVSTGPFSSLNCVVRSHEQPSLVLENRRRVLDALAIADYRLVVPRLAHGNVALIVDEKADEDALQRENADAVITSHPGIALAITYADCLPILVSTKDGSIIAAIHAGWRGLQCGVIKATIERMREAFLVEDLVAAVGPAISPAGFVVTDDVWRYFHEAWPDFVDDKGQFGHVDLTGIAQRQLHDAGVNNVQKVGGYTDLDHERYYSHRRDRGETGRHIALIAKKLA